jgi:hypothetical protein
MLRRNIQKETTEEIGDETEKSESINYEVVLVVVLGNLQIIYSIIKKVFFISTTLHYIIYFLLKV